MDYQYDTSCLMPATVDPLTQRVNMTYDPSPETLAKYPLNPAPVAPGLTIIDALGNPCAVSRCRRR